MQRIKPIGLNLRKTDFEIPDGYLQESINLQWRDNALRPIPQRIGTNIAVHGRQRIIFHKVGDENTVNVLAFTVLSGIMQWFGTINDGVYTAKSSAYTIPGVTYTPGMSITILNGLIYLMGDGSSISEQYYLQLKYLESDQSYEVKNLYSWKNSEMNFAVPTGQLTYTRLDTGTDWDITFTNGVILIRYALVLTTGEVVLHSAIYPLAMKAFFHVANTSVPSPAITTLVNNHTKIVLSLGSTVLDDNISYVNVYATTALYNPEYEETDYEGDEYVKYLRPTALKNMINELIRTPFYLVVSVSKEKLQAADATIILYADKDPSIKITGFTSGTVDLDNQILLDSIAAGEVMPVDNFSRHKLYGKITAYNGRLAIEKPTTILTEKIWDYNKLVDSYASANAKTAITADAEDGLIKSAPYTAGKMPVSYVGGDDTFELYSILSYPDYRGLNLLFNAYNPAGSNIHPTGSNLYVMSLIKNTEQNISYNTDSIYTVVVGDAKSIASTVPPFVNWVTSLHYGLRLNYLRINQESRPDGSIAGYNSKNRIQFTQGGEFSVFPVENSYRIGEGLIMSVGSNTIVPNETFVVAPLIVGTSDGVYSMNADPSGSNFIASITKIANIPFVSDKTLLIGDAIIFVSDKGLMAIQNSGITNLTDKYFPDRGNGNFPDQGTVYPNYDLLTVDFFGLGGNTMEVVDIVEYMRGAIFAYDSRRDNLWCCNNNHDYSLIYNLQDGQWTMSLIKFYEVAELFGIYVDGDNEIYSRYMIRNSSTNYLLLLSGEDDETMVKWHLLTRPIKLQTPNDFKKINRFYSRCEIYDNAAKEGYFLCGLWGKQDTNKTMKAKNLIAIKGSYSSESMPGGIRQDIPVGRLSGKYKTITVLQGGYSTPDTSINSFDFNASLVTNNINK